MNSVNDLSHQPHAIQQREKINYWIILTIILGISLITTISLFALTLNVARNNPSASIMATPEPSKDLAYSALDPGLPPDPGEAGKATVEGIDSDTDGVRDDVQRYITLTVTDSARHREALRGVAKVIHRELLAQTKEEAIQLAIEGVRTIECLSYLGVLEQDKFEEVFALMLNTEARLRAMDAHNDRISGEVFASLPESLKRSACTFDVEALPN